MNQKHFLNLMLTRARKYRTAFDMMEIENELYNEFFLEVDIDGNQRVGHVATSD